jgi:hypothetical protein
MPEATTKDEMQNEAAKIVDGLKEGLEKLAAEGNGEAKAEDKTKAIIVTELDLLKAENINLRLMVMVNRETIAQNALNEAVRERVAKQEELQEYRAYLEKEYSVDLNTHQIDEKTGSIVPRPGYQQQMQHQVQAKLAQAQAQLAAQEAKGKLESKKRDETKAEEPEDQDRVAEVPEAKTG